MARPAVFLDRDGTLNVERSYLVRPEEMQLLPGVGGALRRLRAAGLLCVVISNQSAVGRGMMSEADLASVHAELNRQLAEAGAILDGIYACPEVDDHPDRKPAPGLLLRAARELGIDLAASWMIGDSARDMQAGRNAGVRGCILVRTGHPLVEQQADGNVHVVDDLSAAADIILSRRFRMVS